MRKLDDALYDHAGQSQGFEPQGQGYDCVNRCGLKKTTIVHIYLYSQCLSHGFNHCMFAGAERLLFIYLLKHRFQRHMP